MKKEYTEKQVNQNTFDRSWDKEYSKTGKVLKVFKSPKLFERIPKPPRQLDPDKRAQSIDPHKD